MTKKDYKILLFGGVITILSSGIYDFIKAKPILSSLKFLALWLWNQIFEFEIKIWHLLLILIFIVAISIILKRVSKNDNPKSNIKFTDYIRDKIHETEWSWTWEHNFLENKWEVHNIIPICKKCGTRMQYETSYGANLTAKCPRCDNRVSGLKDKETIEALIIDNVHQGLHLDKIAEKQKELPNSQY